MPAAALAGSGSGMSDAVCFRAVVASAATPIAMQVDGVPQTLRLGAGASAQLRFAVAADLFASSGDAQDKSIDILVSNYGSSGGMPAISVVRPGATSAAEPSYYLNTTNRAEGYISFAPAANELGGQFSLLLTASNLSFVSVTMRVGGQASQETALQTAKHIVLPNGFPLSDKVGEWGERFYVFYVPPEVDGDITISVDPRQGDADLYVNPYQRGFYSRINSQDERPSVWSSQLPSGQDKVVIRCTRFAMFQSAQLLLPHSSSSAV